MLPGIHLQSIRELCVAKESSYLGSTTLTHKKRVLHFSLFPVKHDLSQNRRSWSATPDLNRLQKIPIHFSLNLRVTFTEILRDFQQIC